MTTSQRIAAITACLVVAFPSVAAAVLGFAAAHPTPTFTVIAAVLAVPLLRGRRTGDRTRRDHALSRARA